MAIFISLKAIWPKVNLERFAFILFSLIQLVRSFQLALTVSQNTRAPFQASEHKKGTIKTKLITQQIAATIVEFMYSLRNSHKQFQSNHLGV